MLLLLLSGIITGILLSAPIGPANLLCLSQGIRYGRLSAFLTGMGAAIGDFIFVIMSLTGLLLLSDFSGSSKDYMAIGSSILLIGSGLWGLFSKTNQIQDHHEIKGQQNIFRSMFQSFILTISNPLTPIGILTSITAVGLGGGLLNDKWVLSAIFGISILLGATAWWLFLSFMIEKLRYRISQKFLLFFNKSASGLLVLIGGYLLFFY